MVGQVECGGTRGGIFIVNERNRGRLGGGRGRGWLRVDDHVAAEKVTVPVNELMPVSVAVSMAKDTDSSKGGRRSAYAIFAQARGVP